MGERRKRKSMWDVEEETKQFYGMSEHDYSHDSGRDHDFPASQTFTAPKSRDHSGQPSRGSNDENPGAQVNGSFVNSRQDSPEGKELGEGNRCYQNMSPGFDGIDRRKYKHSLENYRNDSHRHLRRDRSRSRSRSNSSPRGQTKSRSPIRDYRNQSYIWSDQRSVPDKSFRICRDFSSGMCWKGSQCIFVHSNNSSHGHIYRKSDLQDGVSDSCHGEDEQFRNRSRNAVPCREFVKGKCKWGDTCRFSHHFVSNEAVGEGYPGDYTNAKKDNRLRRSMENKNVSWRIPEFKDNMGNKQENSTLHGLQFQSKDGSSNVQGQNLNQNSENILPGQSFVSNATDAGLNMIWPDPLDGLICDLNGPEAQLGAPLDWHSQMQNHQKAVQMTDVLETKVAPLTNLTVSPIPRFENEHFSENAEMEASSGPVNPMENERGTNEHGNYTKQDNQMQVKQSSLLSTRDTTPDNSKMDIAKSSKLNQETILENSEVNEGNKATSEENKEIQINKHSENLDGDKKVGESIANKDDKAMRVFKNSLIEFVKDILKPTWKEGRLSRDVHKTIVKKVVDKIASAVQADHIPKTQDKVDQYLSFSKPKIAKLVQAYVERSLKTNS